MNDQQLRIIPLPPEQAVKPWQIWQHANGRFYGVITVSNIGALKEDYPKTVVYFDLETLLIFSKELFSWKKKRTLIGKCNPAQKEAILLRLSHG